MGEICVKVDTFNGGHLVAICTPLMKRVLHQYIPESGELVFVDASGGFDRDGYRVFLLMTHSKAGGESLFHENACHEKVVYAFWYYL